jgi:hypothetical protein
VQTVKGSGDEWGPFFRCAQARLKQALHVPRTGGARTASVRLDLVLAVRR